MALHLSRDDFIPLSQFEFQHWGDRAGGLYEHVRPLSPQAAQRVWRRAAELSSATWSGGGDGQSRMNLATDNWTTESVRDWLLLHESDGDCEVIACYQPGIAVQITWRVLCERWLTFFWTGGCIWPLNESWILVHDGDQFAFGMK